MPLLLQREIATPVGPALAGVVEPEGPHEAPGGVCLLEFGSPDRRASEIAALETHFATAFLADAVAGGSALLDRLERELAAYFGGALPAVDIPLCTPGTRFQHEIWAALRAIPFGQTTTYGRLAETVGRSPAAARAVGAACGANRVSVLVPCHRVVDRDYDPDHGGARGLRGFAGGIDLKRRLLEIERDVARQGLFNNA